MDRSLWTVGRTVANGRKTADRTVTDGSDGRAQAHSGLISMTWTLFPIAVTSGSRRNGSRRREKRKKKEEKRKALRCVLAQPSLTAARLREIINNMKGPAAPITDLLRKTIIDSGIPLLQIEHETGVQRASLSRFVRGKNSLRLDIADRLASYLGLELRTTKKPKG
jgi:hypothetical protein